MCRICRVNAADSFERVPPRKAFNDQPSTSFTFMDWLAREEGGLESGTIEQRGAGDAVLCQSCNNNTGSWYGSELVRAARAGARVLSQLQLDELDARLEHLWVNVVFKQQAKIGPHPLRFIKQVVAMLLATSPYDVSVKNHDLGDFVLERERTGLNSKYQIYLALFAGPNARTTGVASHVNFDTGRTDILVEVAYPPFAYVMTIDSEPEAIASANITSFVDVGYSHMADLDLGMLVGFGHTPFPADYRTKAMIEREPASNPTAPDS